MVIAPEVEALHLAGHCRGAAADWKALHGAWMSQRPKLESENRRLEAEVRDLREDLRRLTLRVDRQGDQLSELSFSVLSGASGSQIAASSAAGVEEEDSSHLSSQGAGAVGGEVRGAGGYTWAEREAVAKEIGAFLKRSLSGEHRGESGRSKLKNLQNRVDKDNKVYDPVLLVKSYSEVRSLCQSSSGWGDSIFVGLPSAAEASIATCAAGLRWPPPPQ